MGFFEHFKDYGNEPGFYPNCHGKAFENSV